MKRFKFLSLLVAVAMLIGAFAPAYAQAEAPTAQEPAPQSIAEIASADKQFSTLVAALSAAGLVDTLSKPGTYTVFAPTDAAFNKLGKATIDALLADPEKLKGILLYHVAPRTLEAADVVSLSSFETLNGASAVVSAQAGRVKINNANVTKTDIKASNGIIHVLDTVILPPDKNVVEIAAGDPQFSTLVAAVQAAGLAETLSGKGPFTVFAPTNAAFNKLGKATIDALLADPETLKGILTYHVLGSKAYSADAAQLSSAVTVNGAPVTFRNANGRLTINGAQVTVRDIQGTNGVIHVIDTVMLPPSKNVVEIAAGDNQFSTLVAAVQAAGLAETLSGKGPFTVFAPTNAAFNKLGKATIDALLADPETLKGILTYHVLGSAAYSGDAARLSSAATVNGAPVTFGTSNGRLQINGANITVTDILGTNGVIHVIDTVILPPDKNVVEIAAGNPQFSTLVAAVQAAGLADTLSGKGPFTVFAPTNAAFNKLGKATIDALLADPEKLKGILTYHVLQGAAYSGDAAKLAVASTVNGAPVKFGSANGRLQINGANITSANLLGTNGVIHVIDTVILPPDKTVVEIAAADRQFSTLVAAVQAAGLVETLSGKGPFTVFAPTDAAFAALGKETIDALLADPEKLKAILTYHVAGEAIYSSDLSAKGSFTSVNGAPAAFKLEGGSAYINGAKITAANILASNGVIHVIDAVILPPDKNIVEIAAADPQFSTLVAAVQAAGLAETLSGKDALTVFAPTNAAFAALGQETIDALLKDTEKLKGILTYHVVAGAVYAEPLAASSMQKTVNGAEFKVEKFNGKLYVNQAQIVVKNVMASNGVIHVIDAVILPPES